MSKKSTLMCSDCDDLRELVDIQSAKLKGLEFQLEEFKKLSSPGEKAHKLIWALDNLLALGEAVIVMSLYNLDSFEMFGPAMGQMIKDYSETVQDILSSSGKNYEEFFEDQGKGAPAKVAANTEAPEADQ